MIKQALLIALFGVSCSIEAQSVFNPITYQARPYNQSVLSQAMKQREERMNKAYDSFSDLCDLIAEKYSQIHQDEESVKWFQQNIVSLAEKVDDEIENGNYGEAHRLAISYKGEIYSNSELMARIKTNKEYTEVYNLVMSRSDISYEEKQEWKKKYPYKFVPMKGYHGEIIGAYDWLEVGGPDNTPVVIP